MAKGKKEPPKTGPFSGLKDLRDKMAKEAEEKAKAGAKPKASGAVAPRAQSSTPSTSAHGRRESADEDLDFHRLMSGVTPLDDKHRRVPRAGAAHDPNADRTHAENKQRKPRGAEVDTTMEHLRVLVDEGSKFEVTDDGRRVEGHRVDVPPDFVRRLRRGGFPVDATLDLHGRTAAESREALEAFLRDKRARGERCVLVVHGKGAHSPAGVGILRGEMSAWLSQGPASAHVAAFTTALETDGGEGAVYVLLRR